MQYSSLKNVYPNFNFDTNKTLNEVISPTLKPVFQAPPSSNSDVHSFEKVSGAHPSPALNSVVAYDEQEYKTFAKNLMGRGLVPASPIVPRVELTEKVPSHVIETFQETIQPQPQTQSQLNCDDNMKHVLNCSSCKSIIIKQLGLDADKTRNEEFMELLSYIVFGIFMLMLIDNSKR